MFWKKSKNLSRKDIEPDEIFLDSANLPGFDRELFEGRLESPISYRVPYFIFALFLLGLGALIIRLIYLQFIYGDEYLRRAENNRLVKVGLNAERGLIYDRNMKELAWNVSEGRAYWQEPGLSHVAGYVGYAGEDQDSGDSRKKVGKAGIEKAFAKELAGRDGLRLVEEDALGHIISESMEDKGENGRSLVLTIDAELQSELFKILRRLIYERGFLAGSGIIVDTLSGEILALTSFPEIDSEKFSQDAAPEEVEAFLNDERKPFFFRALEGLYAPGSVFKPVVALGALSEKIIDPSREILSTGSISIPNPYFPELSSVFYDWKPHGLVDMRRAIAVSSNIYFYTIGGGFGNQPGLGARRISEYARKLGFGARTGLELPEAKGFLPTPEWKEKNQPDDPIWRLGDTYNLSIGQGMIQVTPMQMAELAALIAGDGIKAKPHLVKALLLPSGERQAIAKTGEEKIDIPQEALKTVKEGMAQAVEYGTASALSGLGVKVAGKTGTAEVGAGKEVNSWFIGFLPYDEPRVALAIVLEKGSASNLVGAVFGAREIISWMIAYKPEILGIK